MDTNYIIETKNLTKQYGSQKSVADLNIHVKRGRIYGLLGRNGAVLLRQVFCFNDIICIHIQNLLFCKVFYHANLALTLPQPCINLAI